MNQIKILGIQVTDRIKEAGQVQKILTRFSNCIRTRLGFHELNDAVCSRTGFIILELCGNISEQNEFEAELKQVGGIEVRDMKFHL